MLRFLLDILRLQFSNVPMASEAQIQRQLLAQQRAKFVRAAKDRENRASGNQGNCRKAVDNSSGFKGVQKHGPSWLARISHNGKRRNLGCYPTPSEAAKAYNRKAIELFGEFANINSIPERG